MNARVLSVRNGIARLQLRVRNKTNHFSGLYEYNLKTNELLPSGPTAAPRNSIVGLFYNPKIWGALPGRLRAGQTWKLQAPMSDYTPAGTVTVRVQAIDPSRHRMVLVRSGAGTGPTGVTSSMKVTTTGPDGVVTSRVTTGRSTWHGRMELVDGIAVRNEFSSTTHLQLSGGGSLPARSTVFKYSAVLSGSVIKQY